MNTLCTTSVQLCAMRILRLEADGSFVVGPDNAYITDSMITLEIEPDIEDGEEIEQATGCGDLCVSFRDDDRLKRLSVSMEICTIDPELHEILVGGEVLTDLGGDTIGYQYPRIGKQAPTPVSIEAWTKNIDVTDPHVDYPWIRFTLPRVKMRIGSKTAENAAMTHPLEGFASENPSFGLGPLGDLLDPADAAAQFQFDTDIPTADCGWQTLVPVGS